MDPIPCKREQFWIRTRVNAAQKVDRIQNGSDPIWIRSRVNGALAFQCPKNYLRIPGKNIEENCQTLQRLYKGYTHLDRPKAPGAWLPFIYFQPFRKSFLLSIRLHFLIIRASWAIEGTSPSLSKTNHSPKGGVGRRACIFSAKPVPSFMLKKSLRGGSVGEFQFATTVRVYKISLIINSNCTEETIPHERPSAENVKAHL